MDPGDQHLTLEDFSSWKTENLRQYLTMRGLSKSGRRDEMIALCFSAAQLDLPIIQSKSEILEGNKTCYDALLKKAGIPDPLLQYDGWLDEKVALPRWPPIFLSDITSFLLLHGDIALTNHMLKDYKVGKAYEYYTSGWLQEVFYHQVPGDRCILRAKCSPSQRLKEDLHDIWVAVTESDGTIHAAYCSCTAG